MTPVPYTHLEVLNSDLREVGGEGGVLTGESELVMPEENGQTSSHNAQNAQYNMRPLGGSELYSWRFVIQNSSR